MPRFVYHFLICFVLSLTTASNIALAEAVTQENAHRKADRLNRIAANVSMEESSIKAMSAAMHAAALNIGGAIYNGKRSHYNYLNAKTLNLSGDLSRIDAYKTGSLDKPREQKIKELEALVKPTVTSYKNLDPSFLRKKKYAKIVDKFEEESGMSGEDFLKHLGEASEQELSVRDPEFMDKLLTRAEGFVDKFPNQDFRDKLKSTIDLVPETARTGVVAKIVSGVGGIFAGTDEAYRDFMANFKKSKAEETDLPTREYAGSSVDATAVKIKIDYQDKKQARSPASNTKIFKIVSPKIKKIVLDRDDEDYEALIDDMLIGAQKDKPKEQQSLFNRISERLVGIKKKGQLGTKLKNAKIEDQIL